MTGSIGIQHAAADAISADLKDYWIIRFSRMAT